MLDITLRPQPGTEGASVQPASPIRFYESSWPGLVTVALEDGHGIRLTLEQVAALFAELDWFLTEQVRSRMKMRAFTTRRTSG